MIKDLNAALGEQSRRYAAYLAICRYAAVAAGKISEDISPDITPEMRSLLAEVAEPTWSVDDARLRAELESRVMDYLDLFDEEPLGATYYPYSAVLLILTALPLLNTPGDTTSLNSLWEWSMRFAKHVDWELKRNRILIEQPDQFEKAEERIWLAHSRLPGVDNTEYRHLQAISRRFAADCVEALACALSSFSSADYIVIFEDAVQSGFYAAVGSEHPDLRIALGESIYTANMNDGNLTYFTKPGFAYVWASDAAVVADFLRTNLDVRALVDTRRPDGMVLEADAFVREPLPSVARW